MFDGPINRWWTVVAGAMGCAAGSGIVVLYTFPLFATGFQQEFGWDRLVYSYCLTVYLISTGFGTLSLGLAIRRFGVRRAAASYVLLFSTAIAGIAVLPHSPGLFYLTFAIIGFGGAAATAMPYAVAVAGWFDAHRGLALGLLNSGAGFGSACAPLVAGTLMSQFGWRGGFLGVGLLAGCLALFGLIVLVREPTAQKGSVERSKDNVTQASFRFLKARQFWLIAIPIVGVSIATFGVMGTIVAFLRDRELGAPAIALTLSTAGIASWMGRVVTGFLLDRVFAPYLAALTFLLAVIAIVLLAFAVQTRLLMTGAALIGVTLGAEGDLVVFLLSRYYDYAIYSRVLGAIWICWAWGGGIGTFVAGTGFRLTHSYLPGLGIFVAVLFISALVISKLGPYKYPLGSAIPVTTPE